MSTSVHQELSAASKARATSPSNSKPLRRWMPPIVIVGASAAMLLSVRNVEGYSFLGGSLALSQRDFRIWNNFTAPGANNNQTPDPSFPGYQGAVMAIWKGCVEWQSALHGSGQGDPHQPGGIGSGGADFDPSFQGENVNDGGQDGNTHSQISGCNGGVLAYCEFPISNGWRIRYYECWNWEDGPGATFSGFDVQGVAAHEYGHALGLGHSDVGGSTMWPSVASGDPSNRSIAPDDVAGVQALYGVASATKPSIDAICISGTQLTITGVNFSPTGNEVWFTKTGTGGNGTPIKVTNLPSNGTTIVVAIPGTAGPGDILVRNNGVGSANLSNSWPTDLQPTGGSCTGGGSCPDPVNYCVTSPNSVGPGMVMGYFGSTCISNQDLTLTASGGPPNQLGIFYYGENQTQVPFGNGFRCVGPGIAGTFRLPVVQIDFFGDVSYPVDFTSPPFDSGPGAWLDGSIWYVQFWYRDPSDPPAGYNLSDGLEVPLGP